MITVNVQENEVLVQGHSYAAQYGKDIICAAVSTLVCTLINAIESLTEDKIEYEITEGYSVIHYKENFSEKSKLLIDSFFIGIVSIVERYPDHVRIV